jgi:hypothetical protein
MRARFLSTLIAAAALAAASSAAAEPVLVRFTEGVARGFPVLRSVDGQKLAQGELWQVARGDRVENRLVFHFANGSLYDEQVVFSQRDVFSLISYRIVQRGPSFPETLVASIDRETGQYHVRYQADRDSAEEVLSGNFSLPSDAYNGMLGLLLKNLAPGASEQVQIVAFTPKPRTVKILLQPVREDKLVIGDQTLSATRFLVKPQLGMLASLLVADLVPGQLWVVNGDAPAFVKFQGPLYFMGPIWHIELN